MRSGGLIFGAALGAAIAACVPTGQFSCAEDAQCSQLSGGRCEEDGRCSYPDESCDSRRRYSDYAGSVAGQCVEPPSSDATTTSGSAAGSSEGDGGESSSSSSTTGDPIPLPPDCDGVTCSGAGTCVMVEGVPTCACNPGLYAVGVQCLEDPCATETCYFVDAEVGLDDNPGTRDEPWQTIARLEDGLDAAAPGDHFLLRRGRTWTGQLDIGNVDAELDAPIVIGAYGPVDEPKPALAPGAVRIVGSEHIVVRDLRIEDDATLEMAPNRPCVMIERSQQIVILANELITCTNRAIRLHEETQFTVIADNVVRDVVDNEAIFVSDAAWTVPPTVLLAHHWVIDNVVANAPEDGIFVSMDDPTGDVKVLGNRVVDVGEHGINVYSQGYVWVGGNVVARAGDPDTVSGEGINLNVREEVVAYGNVVLDSVRGLQVGRHAQVTSNTIIGHHPMSQAAQVRAGATTQVWRDNLVLAIEGGLSIRDAATDGSGDAIDLEGQWYAPDCMFEISGGGVFDLAGWQAATMTDATSACGDGAGVNDPGAPADPLTWDAAFFDALVPDAAWERCGAEAGAYACDGSPRVTAVEPIADYFESDGFGWPGPLLVKQRYPAPE